MSNIHRQEYSSTLIVVITTLIVTYILKKKIFNLKLNYGNAENTNIKN